MVTCDELPMVVFTRSFWRPWISDPMKTWTETPMAIPSIISKVCALLEEINLKAIDRASFI